MYHLLHRQQFCIVLFGLNVGNITISLSPFDGQQPFGTYSEFPLCQRLPHETAHGSFFLQRWNGPYAWNFVHTIS